MLFVNRYGDPISIHGIEYIYNSLKIQSGININSTPHYLRHTFATNMQYLPPKTLQYILGHGRIATTMDNYIDVKPSDEQLIQVNTLATQIVAN